ncbi:MAG: hypothetical protein V1822_00185 [Candidatus Micrarchaeota archaeon]
MVSDIPTLIQELSALPLKEILTVLVGRGVYDFTKSGYASLKELIRRKHLESKYAFVPDKEEAKTLSSIAEGSEYKQLQMFIPNYRYIDVLRAGILIARYHRQDRLENRERVGKIKEQVMRKPNGKHLIKIANLPSTPFFKVILRFLYTLKEEKNYTTTQLEETFDEIVSEWQKTTLFVKTETNTEDIVQFCERQVEKERTLFFLLGMRTAVKRIEDALERLRIEKFFEKNCLRFTKVVNEEGNHPRTEVTISKIWPE